MARARTKLLVLAVVAAATLLGLRLTRSDSADPGASGDEALIDGRFWVEGRPEKLTDYVHGAFFISRANLGIFERASAYDIRFEIFDLSRSGTNLKIFFPQTKKESKSTFTLKKCSDKPPFDLCLDLADNPWGGPKRYYGFEKPEDERAMLGDRASRMRARVPAAAR